MFLKKEKIRYGRQNYTGWDQMGCPYYQDLTRLCIQHFPRVMEYPSFGTCDSEDYHNCLAYITLMADFRCKYQNLCIEDLVLSIPFLVKFFIEDDKTFQFFKKVSERYCTSEQNHVNCACFKSYEQGIHPPIELLPDGKKFRLRDLVLKKELILD